MTTDIRDLEEAWQAEPGNPETFSALAGRYILDGSWRKLVALFEEGADRLADDASYGTKLVQALRELEENASDAQERGAILVAIGDAYQNYVDDREEAMKAYQASFKMYPGDTTCLQRARQIYRRSGDFERIFLLYKLELKVKDEPEPRADVLINMAQVRGDDLRDFEGGVQIVNEALKLTPDDEFAQDLLAVYEAGSTMHARQQELLRDADEAEDAGEPEMAAELLAMATKLEKRREAGTSETALEYAERARDLKPEDGTIGRLVSMLMLEVGREDELESGQAVSMMAPVDVGQPTNGQAGHAEPSDAYHDDEQVENGATQRIDLDTVQAFQDEDRSRTAEASEGSEASSEDDSSEGEIRETYQMSPDSVAEMRAEDMGAETGESSAEVDSDQPVAEEAAQAEEEAVEEPVGEEMSEDISVDSDAEHSEGTSDEAAGETAGVSTDVSEPAEALEVVESAEPVELESVGAYIAALGDEPADLGLLRGLYDAVKESGEWDRLVDQYEVSLKRLRKQEGELETMVRLANVLWLEVDDLERAEYFFKRVKLLDSEQDDMLDFYEAYFEGRGEWRKLFAMLSTAQQHADDPARRLRLAERLAQIAEQSMESPEKAIDVWKSYLRDEPQDLHAREELRRLYEQNAKWSALVDFFKEDLHQLEQDGGDDAERAELLRKMSTIYDEHLGLEPMVVNTLQDILSIEPDDEAAFSRLRELLVSSRRLNDLAGLLNERAESEIEAGNIAAATEYLVEVATIWMDNLRNVTQALPYLERVLEIDPEHAEVREKLKEIYEKRRDYASLFKVLRKEVEGFEGEERVARLRELVDLSIDRIRDPSLAVPVLHEILEHVPGDDEALNKLEFIHRRRDEFDALAEVLIRRAGFATEPSAQMEHLSEAAQIHEEHLSNPDAAREIWREILAIDPNDQRALAALTRMYVAALEFDELDAIYRERDALDQLYDLLDSAAAAAESLDVRRAVYRKMARLAEEDLGAPDRVIISLESLLELAEDRQMVARELITWYQRVGDLGREIEMNQLLLDSASESDARLDTLERLRELEAKRADATGALKWALEAVRAAPSEPEVSARAEELARQVDALEAYLQTLEDIAEVTEERELQESLWARIGRIQWEDLQNYGTALVYFERLHESEPTNLEWLAALERLYDLAGEGAKRIGVLRTQIDVLKDRGASDADVVDEYRKIADVQREMGDPDAARNTYAEILDMDPDNFGALRGIKEIYRAEQRWEDVVDCLLQEQALAPLDDEAARVAIDLELADVYRLHTDQLEEALRQYGQVLTMVPDQEDAVAAVETLLAEPELAREAALMLEPIFRETKQIASLVGALESRRKVTEDRFEEAEILDELIPLYMNDLEDRETAFDRACRQFELDPDRSEIWLRLEQLGAGLDRWQDLESIFSRFAPEDKQAHPTRFELLKHLAAIREYKLGMQEEALQAWEQLREYDPLDLATMEALDRLYRQLGRHEHLVSVLESRAEVADEVGQRVELLMEAAQIADQVVADTDKTIDLLRKVLLADPDDQQASDDLLRLLAREGRYGELEEHLSAQADFAADPVARREYQLQLARVRWEHLEDFGGAAQIVTQLLTNDPGDAAALMELQELDHRLSEADRPDLRLELAAVVEPIHRSNEDWPALASVLRTRLESTEDPFDRVVLLDELSGLYVEKLDDQEAAFATVSEAVRISPEDEERREILELLGEQLDRTGEVLTTLAHAADAADSYVAADLFRRMGELYRDRMGAADEAIACFEHALKAHATDEELLAALGELYEQTGDHEKLAENLRQQSIYGDPDRRADFLRRIGVIEYDVLQRPDAAISAYEELLEAEPNSEDAMSALEMLYESEERWLDLTDILSRRANSTADAQAQLEAWTRLAGVQERRIDDRQGAIDTYRQVLALDPTHEPTLDELQRLHKEEGQWADLSEVLRAKLRLPRAEGDAEFHSVTQLQLADVLSQELYAVDEALTLYRQVLERHPGQHDAIAALERISEDEAHVEHVADDLVPHYREAEQWEKLVGLYERLQVRTHDPELRSEYFNKIGIVQRDHLQDLDAAIDAFAEAWKLSPGKDGIHDALFSLAAQNQQWAKLAQIYQDVLIEVTDPDRMLNLRLMLATLYFEQLDKPADAELQYREALAIDDRHTEAYSALESILASGERWLDMVELLESKFAATAVDDPEAARGTLYRVAQVQEDLLDDGFSAVDTYNRILEFEPTDSDAQEGVERLYRKQERWEDLNAHLVRRIELTKDPEEAVRLKSELADLTLHQMMDPLGALELHREILEVEPEHADTLKSLQMMFEQMDGFRAEAGRLLEPVLRRNDLWDNLVVVLINRAENIDFRDEAPTLLREVGEIAMERLGDEAMAYDAYANLFTMEPSDQQVRVQLREIAAANQRWESLTELYSKTLADNYEIGDDLRIELLAEQGSLYEERLEDLDRARETYEQITTYDPESDVALDALDRIYSRQRDWPALADLYRRRADMTFDPERRVDWLYHLGNLHEEILDDLAAAVDVYSEIVQVDPLAKQPRRILERLLRQSARWHDLANLFREEADTAEDAAERRENLFRLAQLLETELEQFEDALELYREIILEEPMHYETRRALEGLLRDLALEDSDHRLIRQQIIDMLLDVYSPEDDLDKVVALLEQKGEIAEDVPTKTEMNRRIADLLENSPRTEDRIRGMVALANAYRVDPLNNDLKRRVNKIAMETDTWDKLIPLYLLGLELNDNLETRANLLNTVAEIYAGPLSDSESAITAYRQVIAVAPDNEKALSQLEKLYGELELWEPLVEVLVRRVDIVYDAELQERLLRRVARIQEEILAEPAAAVDAVERLRELAPSNLEYVETLERIYEEVARYEELEELLRLKVGLVEGDEKRLKTLRNLARVQDEALKRPEDAIESYRSVLAIDEEDIASVKALTRLYAKVERWVELLETLQIERDFSGGLDELNQVDLRMGIVLAERLGQGHEAISKFNEVLERDPHFGPARAAMRKLLGNPETGEQVQVILETLFRENQEWSELEKLYESLLEQVDDYERRKAAYLSLAQLQEQELANEQMAFVTFGRAVREAPQDSTFRTNLERLAADNQSMDELLAVYEDCVEAEPEDVDALLWLHNRLGALYFDLEAFDEAIEHFVAALEIDEYDKAALAALDDLYQIKQDWESLAAIIERELSVVEPDEVNDARYRLGYLHEVMFENSERALDLYAQILADEPGHVNTVDAMERLSEDQSLRPRIVPILEPILRDLGEYDRLVDLYALQLDLLEDPLDRALVLEKIANVHLDHLGNLEVGYAFLSRSLRADSGSTEVQIRLEALVDTIDMHEELVALYEELMEQLDDPIRIVELALVAGTVSYGTLDDVDRAWRLFEKVLEIDNENEPALAAMEEIARDQGDPLSLAGVLAREAAIVFDPDQRKRILADLGRVRVELEEYERAADAFRKALEIDESDPQVLDALVEVLEFTEQYEELVDMMQRLVMFESDPDEQFKLYVRMGRYSRVLLKDNERATEAYRAALGINPDDDDVLRALAELFEESEDWEKLRKVLDRRIQVTAEDDVRVPLYLRLAEISRDKFNEVERAIEEYESALSLAPTYAPTIEALGTIYREEERWSELLAMYERVLEATPSADMERVIELQVEMADISAKYVGDEDSAMRYLQSILEIDPNHLRALAVLADLYGQRGDWDTGLQLMERRMKACRTKEEQIDALLHRARIFADELKRPKDAANDYVRIVELVPLHEEALGALKELYGERLQAHKALFDILKYEASYREDPDVKLELYLEMASIGRDVLADPALTIEALEAAYGIRGNDLEIVEPLLDAYISGGAVAKAEPLLDAIIEQLKADRKMKDVVRFMHLQGRLAEQKGDLDGAFEAYDAAHKVDASYIPNLLSLGKLLYQREDWDQALKIFQTLLLHQMNIEKDADKVDIYHHLGMVRWHQGDTRRAKDMFNRALNIDGSHEPSKEAMSQL